MREIKFRAWDKQKKQILEVREITYLVDEGTPVSILAWEPDAKEKTNAYLTTLAPDMFELMQYTGLKDKNGKEIYEGDICRNVEPNVDAGVFVVERAEFGWNIHICDKQVQIEGNIYENPELLK